MGQSIAEVDRMPFADLAWHVRNYLDFTDAVKAAQDDA